MEKYFEWITIVREEKSLRHVAMEVKFFDDNKLKIQFYIYHITSIPSLQGLYARK